VPDGSKASATLGNSLHNMSDLAAHSLLSHEYHPIWGGDLRNEENDDRGNGWLNGNCTRNHHERFGPGSRHYTCAIGRELVHRK